MTDSAAIVADVHSAIDHLAGADDPSAIRVAQALAGWLRGTDFEASLGLVPGWRSHLRLTARDRALASLVAMHSDLDDSKLACFIATGIERMAAVGGVRPDGADGYLTDLACTGASLSKRQWRRLIHGYRAWPSRLLNGQGD